MTEPVGVTVREGVALIRVDAPPVNALSRSVRAGLDAALTRVLDDDEVQEIVLIGAGRTFPAGADIAEFEAPLAPPHLSALCDRIEASPKPVVAALHGTALGGGLELALAAHYRVAHEAARIGFPEIKLGLLPGAGGTQRAPRLVGAAAALDLMLSGRMVGVDRPPGQTLCDLVTGGDLEAAAHGFCLKLRADGRGPRRTRDADRGLRDPEAYRAAVTARRKEVATHPLTAAREIVAAVEAAQLMPFDQGIAFEETAFADCLSSAQSAALRHVFFAERRAARFDLPNTAVIPEIRTLGVLGGGPLAVQLVAAALGAGVAVHWGTRDPARLVEGQAQVTTILGQGVKRGAMTEAQKTECLSRLATGDSAAMVEGADMLVHAARGQGDVPAPRGMVRAVAMSGRVAELGLRFVPPIHQSSLVEVVEGPDCRAHQLAAALGLARALGKVPVQVASGGDSIAGRLMAALQRGADALVDLGLSPYAIDDALRRWGWPRPPFEMRDLLGLSDLAEAPRAAGAANWSARLLSAGRTGRSGGAGFYVWDEGAAHGRPDDRVAQLLAGSRPGRAVTDADGIVSLLIGAMANEGARMLDTGMARRPGDIDIVAILAHAFPRWRGGPMMAAGDIGLLELSRRMRTLGHPDTGFWEPMPIFAELIKNGERFDALDRPA